MISVFPPPFMSELPALYWSDDPEREPHIVETHRILEQSQRGKLQPYSVQIAGRNFFIHPNVFPSSYFNDTEFFARNFPFQKNERLLEIGPGAGVISVLAALQGADVTAVDINPAAVENTKHNAELHCVAERMRILQGDVYDPLPPTEHFDTIFWNVPFGYVKLNLSLLERSVFDTDYRSIERCIRGAPDRLVPGGKLLLGFSTVMGRFDLLQKYLKSAGCSTLEERAKIVHDGRSLPLTFELFEAKFSSSIPHE